MFNIKLTPPPKKKKEPQYQKKNIKTKQNRKSNQKEEI